MPYSIQDINEMRNKGRQRANAYIDQYKKMNQGNPKQFRDSTFLYIRSYEEDVGERNPGIADSRGGSIWLSPDIDLFDSRGISIETLQERSMYSVQVTIRNSGDLNVYACTVELYLCDPSLGFALDSSDTILVGIQSAEVMSGSFTRVIFPFEATNSRVGHKCMFARVHSVVNREIPAVMSTLDPFHNRHDAQQNIVVLAQAEMMNFKMTSFDPMNDAVVKITPATTLPKKLLVTTNKMGFKISQNVKLLNLVANQFIILTTQNEQSLLARTDQLQPISPALRKELPLDLNKAVGMQILKRTSDYTWNLKFEKAGTQKASLLVPRFQLPPGEVGVFHLTMFDKAQKIVGGITLIVK